MGALLFSGGPFVKTSRLPIWVPRYTPGFPNGNSGLSPFPLGVFRVPSVPPGGGPGGFLPGNFRPLGNPGFLEGNWLVTWPTVLNYVLAQILAGPLAKFLGKLLAQHAGPNCLQDYWPKSWAKC